MRHDRCKISQDLILKNQRAQVAPFLRGEEGRGEGEDYAAARFASAAQRGSSPNGEIHVKGSAPDVNTRETCRGSKSRSERRRRHTSKKYAVPSEIKIRRATALHLREFVETLNGRDDTNGHFPLDFYQIWFRRGGGFTGGGPIPNELVTHTRARTHTHTFRGTLSRHIAFVETK